MRAFLTGISLLLLAACGESPAPPKPAAATTEPKPPAPAMEGKAPMMEAKAAPAVKPPAEEKPAEKPPAEPRKKKEPVDKLGRAKSPELFKKHMALMDENGDLVEAIEADLEAKRYESAVKPKVVKIRKNGEAARELHYRKDPDQDTALTNDFDLFLLKMKKIEESVWDEASSHDLLENLRGRCLTCHDTYQ